MGGNLPGQSETLCGQPIQVAACGSHSAGIRTLLISQKPVLNAVVRVGAAVAQEWPVAAHLFDPCQVDLRHHQRLVFGGLGYHHAERVTDERVAPEFDPRSLAAELLESDAIYRRDPATVRDGVAALSFSTHPVAARRISVSRKDANQWRSGRAECW